MATIEGETWTATIGSFDIEYFKQKCLSEEDIARFGVWKYGWTSKDSATGSYGFAETTGTVNEPSQQEVEDTYYGNL